MTSKSIGAVFLSASLMTLLGTAQAAEPCRIRSAQDVLQCALERHPDVALSDASLARDRFLISIARQRPNPELETKILAGVDQGADNDLETESRLLHTVELGGKRKARVQEAKAAVAVASAELRKTREEVALATVVALHRLRQIRIESRELAESLGMFTRALDPFRKRPLLSPEQSVSRSVFEMAREEYRLKAAGLRLEEEELKSSLELATGLPYAAIEKYLPRSKNSWPRFEDGTSLNGSAGLLQKAEAESKLAAAGTAAAKSRSWPDLKIGPNVETATPAGAGATGTRVGGTVSLPLPLLNLNQGGRRYAAAELARASLSLQKTREKLDAERRFQLARYRAAVRFLSATRSRASWTEQHRLIDDLFERGLAPSALVLEGHRQMIDVLQARHAQEIGAIDAYWRLLILDGHLEKGIL